MSADLSVTTTFKPERDAGGAALSPGDHVWCVLKSGHVRTGTVMVSNSWEYMNGSVPIPTLVVLLNGWRECMLVSQFNRVDRLPTS